MRFRTKKFRNQEFLYGISFICNLAKIKHFYNTKLPAFVFFFADIGVLNTRKFVGICKALLH